MTNVVANIFVNTKFKYFWKLYFKYLSNTSYCSLKAQDTKCCFWTVSEVQNTFGNCSPQQW